TNGATLLTSATARWSFQCSSGAMRCRATQTAHGTRNSAAHSARPSDTAAVPKNGTATRRKMYWNDHMVASASHRLTSYGRKTLLLLIHALHRFRGVARACAGADRGRFGDTPDF